MNDRVTITINREIYRRLKEKGIFGETYNQLILRLVRLAEAHNSEVYDID
jgi:predicted CopG family antitoxin